jgi:putative serine protease PepD
VGIGFAIPSNTVRQVVPQLERGQVVPHAYLGLSSSASPNGAPGAVVDQLVPGGPADRGGVQVGDVVTSVDGRSVIDPSDISATISQRKPGDEVTVTVQRAGALLDLHVQLGQRPTRTP